MTAEEPGPSCSLVVLREDLEDSDGSSAARHTLCEELVLNSLVGQDIEVGDLKLVPVLGGRLLARVIVDWRSGAGPKVDHHTEVILVPYRPRALPKRPVVWPPFVSLCGLLARKWRIDGGIVIAIVGDSGCGKTTAVNEACCASDFALIRISAPDLHRRGVNSDFRGVLSQFVRKAENIQAAGRAAAIFLDDVDSLEKDRRAELSLTLGIRQAAEERNLTVLLSSKSLAAVPPAVQALVEHVVEIFPPLGPSENSEIIDNVQRELGTDVLEAKSAVSRSVRIGPLPREAKAATWDDRDSIAPTPPERCVQSARHLVSNAFASASGPPPTRVFGLEPAREAVEEAVIWPWKRAEQLDRAGIRAPCGILLYGAPGTGKTALAKSITKELGCPVIPLDAASLLRAEVGVSEQNLASAFRHARALQPCLLFLDEVDSLFEERVADSGRASRLVSALALEMDAGEVAVLAATNRPWDLDPSLLRIGRFERCIPVKLPEAATRRDILQQLVQSVDPMWMVDGNPSAFDRLVHRTDGFTGADLHGLARKAKLLTRAAASPASGAVKYGFFVEMLYRALETTKPSVSAEDVSRLTLWGCARREWEDRLADYCARLSIKPGEKIEKVSPCRSTKKLQSAT